MRWVLCLTACILLLFRKQPFGRVLADVRKKQQDILRK